MTWVRRTLRVCQPHRFYGVRRRFGYDEEDMLY